MSSLGRGRVAGSARGTRREQFISTAALATALLLAFASTAALNLNLRRLRESFDWVDHADRVLLQVGLLQSNVEKVVAAARSYAVTGEPAAADLLTQSREALPGRLAALQKLVADNPDQLHRTDTIADLIGRRIDRLDDHPRREASSLPETVVDGPEDRQLATGITTTMDEFRATEITQLAEGERLASRDAAVTTWFAAGTMLLALASGGFGIFLLQRERQRHRLLELETELILVSRLNTVGQTASVLAHEVNQPLTATRNYLNGARRLLSTSALPEAARIRDALELATTQMERATRIISRLRRHVQGVGPDRITTPAAALIEDAVALSGLRSAELKIRLEIERGLPDLFVDPAQVQQVLINLMRNAFEAMEASTPRELVLIAIGERETVRISVRDTGIGMPPDLAARLFRPFTSTKAQGMGVGLSICRSIVEAHGGRIWAEANADRGTTFSFTVPIARPAAATAAARQAGTPSETALHSPG